MKKKTEQQVRETSVRHVVSRAAFPMREVAALQAWRVELAGGRELQVDGCRGIVRYDPQTVCFRVAGAVFCVYGQDLMIDTMQAGSLTVRGHILRTELIP